MAPVELIETKPGRAMVIVKSLTNRPGIAAELFSILGSGGFNIEMIAETGVSGNIASVSFALDERDAEKAAQHLKDSSSLKVHDVEITNGLGVMTFYGKLLAQEPGIAGKIFSLLAQEAINIEMISTGFTSISILVKQEYLNPAKNLITKELGINA